MNNNYSRGEYVCFRFEERKAVNFGRIVSVNYNGNLDYAIAPFNHKHFFDLPVLVQPDEIMGLVYVFETALVRMRPAFSFGFLTGCVFAALVSTIAYAVGGI